MNFRYRWVTYRDGVRDGCGSIVLRNQISKRHAYAEAAERLKRTGLWRPKRESLAGELMPLPDDIPPHVAGMVAALSCHVGLAILPVLMPLIQAHPFICLFIGAGCMTVLFFLLVQVVERVVYGRAHEPQQKPWRDLDGCLSAECSWWASAWQKALYVHARRRMTDAQRDKLLRILSRWEKARCRKLGVPDHANQPSTL